MWNPTPGASVGDGFLGPRVVVRDHERHPLLLCRSDPIPFRTGGLPSIVSLSNLVRKEDPRGGKGGGTSFTKEKADWRIAMATKMARWRTNGASHAVKEGTRRTWTGRGRTVRSRNARRKASAAESAPEGVVESKWRAWLAFTRPHTMVGTALSVASVSMMAAGREAVAASDTAGWKLVQALVAALLMNVSIVGINQVYDVQVDKVNKPYLPLASGAMTVEEGKKIAWVCAAMALIMGAWPWSTPLMGTLTGSLVLGIFYSVDAKGMRWKKNPALAAACIFAVRAVLVQLGFSLHAQTATGKAMQLTKPIALTMGLMAVFSLVIAFFKDIPDVDGDRQNTIRTLSVRMGPRNVFYICMGLLTGIYAVAIAYSMIGCEGNFRVVSSMAHFIFLALLWFRSRAVVIASSTSLYDFYMFIWKLFYAEYLVLPFLG